MYQEQSMKHADKSRAAFSETREKSYQFKAMATAVEEDRPEDDFKGICFLCGRDHWLDTCEEFAAKPLEERMDFLKKEKLCFGCFRKTNHYHYSSVCRSKPECNVCGERHQTLLHNSIDPSFKVSAVKHPCSSVNLSVLPVSICHESAPNSRVTVYALLDPCSQGTFVLESVVESLKLKDIFYSQVTVKTLNGDQQMKSGRINGLLVSKADSDAATSIKLPTTYTQADLPFDAEDVVSRDDLLKWTHFQKMHPKLAVFDESIPFGLLIGANCTKALEPLEVLPSYQDSPYAIRTRLGWCVVGGASSAESVSVKCNLIKAAESRCGVQEVEMHETAMHNKVTDDFICHSLKKMYDREFVEKNADDDAPSRDDKFMEIMQNNV